MSYLSKVLLQTFNSLHLYRMKKCLCIFIAGIAISGCSKTENASSKCMLSSLLYTNNYLSPAYKDSTLQTFYYTDGKVVRRSITGSTQYEDSIFYNGDKMSVIRRHVPNSDYFEYYTFNYDSNGRMSGLIVNATVSGVPSFYSRDELTYNTQGQVIAVKDSNVYRPDAYSVEVFTYSGDDIMTSTTTIYAGDTAQSSFQTFLEYAPYENPVANLGGTNYSPNITAPIWILYFAKKAIKKIIGDNGMTLQTSTFNTDSENKIISAYPRFPSCDLNCSLDTVYYEYKACF
ncbi:MAG: hypothetical protein JWN78_71 [Bacteroidota bacterium]|nr:hypothetical protein [Bacteroidota bacterium]